MPKKSKPAPKITDIDTAVAAAEEAAARLEKSTPRVPAVPDADLLSTGCTVLNLAFSGRPHGGVPKGAYLYVVGDSGSSKTWLGFNLFAEAARNKHFANHRLIFDNAENGAWFHVADYFGQAVADRIEPPAPNRRGSETAQEFYFHLVGNARKGPCIYLLDSMDALDDEKDVEKFEAELSQFEGKSVKVPGSMGMEKAKTNSKNIKKATNPLDDHGSILVIVSQTRAKTNSHIPNQKTRAGGNALKFFAQIEAWTSVRGPLTKSYLGKDREIGALIRYDIQKNRMCGWEGKIDIPFIKGYGFDDLGASVDYLVEEGVWKETAGKITAPEFGFCGAREKLLRHVQDESEEYELARLVAARWKAVTAGAMPYRKPRYA